MLIPKEITVGKRTYTVTRPHTIQDPSSMGRVDYVSMIALDASAWCRSSGVVHVCGISNSFSSLPAILTNALAYSESTPSFFAKSFEYR